MPDHAGAFTSRRVRKVASILDVGPTILELAGLTPQTGIQGVSLLEPESRMALFHADYDRGWLGLRDGCWKYLFEIEAERSLLFDVCADPNETTDRSSTSGPRLSVYRERVTKWAAAVRASVLSRAPE